MKRTHSTVVVTEGPTCYEEDALYSDGHKRKDLKYEEDALYSGGLKRNDLL